MQLMRMSEVVTTETVGFDHESRGDKLWFVAGGIPVDRALLEADVLCRGAVDRLRLADVAPLSGDAVRAQTLIVMAAQAAITGALAGVQAASPCAGQLLGDASRCLGIVVDRLVEVEDSGTSVSAASWVLVDFLQRASARIDASRSAIERMVPAVQPDAGGKVVPLATGYG